jgi:hypothetical protein
MILIDIIRLRAAKSIEIIECLTTSVRHPVFVAGGANGT